MTAKKIFFSQTGRGGEKSMKSSIFAFKGDIFINVNSGMVLILTE